MYNTLELVEGHTLGGRRRCGVKPPVFQPDGTQSLRDFLDSFEQYFWKKYSGNAHDMTQKLADFIDGDLLQVYTVKGGRKVEYEKMKEGLLSYYKKQKIGGRKYWKKKLEEAVPEDGEDLMIYGMRLIELAEKAYPTEKKECATQLRSQFLKTVPASVQSSVAAAERSLKATTGGRVKHINFEAIMQMAADIRKDLASEHCEKAVLRTYPLTLPQAPSTGPGTAPEFDYKPKEMSYAPQTYLNSAYKNRSRGQGEAETSIEDSRGPCSYCKHPFHALRDCWRAAGLCIICGGSHKMPECPRYKENYRRTRVSRALNQ